MENDGKNKRTFTEEFEVAGSQLVEKVKALLEEGNVRQLIIKAQDGDVYLETPLTLGVIAGGAVVLAAPWLAILGAIAALVARVKIEVVREEDDDSVTVAFMDPAAVLELVGNPDINALAGDVRARLQRVAAQLEA